MHAVAAQLTSPSVVRVLIARIHTRADQPFLNDSIRTSGGRKGRVILFRHLDCHLVIVPGIPIKPWHARGPIQNKGSRHICSTQFCRRKWIGLEPTCLGVPNRLVADSIVGHGLLNLTNHRHHGLGRLISNVEVITDNINVLAAAFTQKFREPLHAIAAGCWRGDHYRLRVNVVDDL